MLPPNAMLGHFIGHRDATCVPQVILQDAVSVTGDQLQNVHLRFAEDIRSLLRQGRVPAIYGGAYFADFPAVVIGTIHQSSSNNPVAEMDSITFFELVLDSVGWRVSFAFRLDGGCYDQQSTMEDLPTSAPTSTRVRVRCRFSYQPETQNLSVHTIASDQQVDLELTSVDPLVQRLTLDVNEKPQGGTELLVSGTGIIDGRLQYTGSQNEKPVIIPDVITFETERAVHRLWLNPSVFHWFCEEELVVPLP